MQITLEYDYSMPYENEVGMKSLSLDFSRKQNEGKKHIAYDLPRWNERENK